MVSSLYIAGARTRYQVRGSGTPHSVHGDSMQQGYLTCACGEEVGFTELDSLPDCECGRTYAVTVTELCAPYPECS